MRTLLLQPTVPGARYLPVGITGARLNKSFILLRFWRSARRGSASEASMPITLATRAIYTTAIKIVSNKHNPSGAQRKNDRHG